MAVFPDLTGQQNLPGIVSLCGSNETIPVVLGPPVVRYRGDAPPKCFPCGNNRLRLTRRKRNSREGTGFLLLGFET